MAKLPSNIQISDMDDVNQTIDLTSYLGEGINDRPDLVTLIGQELIDIMVKRTTSGKDINYSAMAPYSSSYVASDEFKAHGKSRKVNMKLTGEMLADINLINEDPAALKIGFGDTLQSRKAHGHITGMRDNDQIPSKHKPAPRLFFGVSSEDISKITQKYESNVKKKSPFGLEDVLKVASVQETAQTVSGLTLDDVLGDIFG